MPGLKKHFSDARFSANRVTPDELDMRLRYQIQYPSISDTAIGTVNSATTPVAFVLDNTKLDHPRNVLLTVLGVAGGIGATATITGTDQFGRAQTETLSFGSAAGGGTVAGTKIFDTVSAGTITGFAALGGTAVGTSKLGFAKGTASGIENLFGLPVKIKATSDIKRVSWINNGTWTTSNGGTIATYIGTANHTFKGSAVVAATDIYVVDILTTYNSENDTNVT